MLYCTLTTIYRDLEPSGFLEMKLCIMPEPITVVLLAGWELGSLANGLRFPLGGTRNTGASSHLRA